MYPLPTEEASMLAGIDARRRREAIARERLVSDQRRRPHLIVRLWRALHPDRLPLVLRPATEHDAKAILYLYDHLSDESRMRRFMAPIPRLTAATRAALSDTLTTATVWIATVGNRCVGEARIVPATEGCAELAVTIADDFQGGGLGQQLAKRAVDDFLLDHGCVEFTAFSDNIPVVKMAARNRVPLRRSRGVVEGTIVPSCC